jgi:MSHA biogenesis protein MshM
MWLRHWGLARDPFGEDRRFSASSFAAIPAHHEAVARLTHTIETAGRSARLIAGAGLGKTTVLERSLAAARSPTRRIARATNPIDGTSLIATLAEGLGARVGAGAGRALGWRSLVDAARLCRFQGIHVVLVVDGCHMLADPVDRLDLDRLPHLDPDPASRLTVLRVGRPDPHPGAIDPPPEWELAIRLAPLTRADAASYLDAKLTSAGRPGPTFTPRAFTRIHALSGGVPRGIDRLAQLALMAGALRGLEMVPPEVVDGSARECDAAHVPASLG